MYLSFYALKMVFELFFCHVKEINCQTAMYLLVSRYRLEHVSYKKQVLDD